MTSCKNINKIIRELLRNGWNVANRSKHIKMLSPKGHRLMLSVSPSCPNAYKQILRRVDKIKELESAT